MTDILILQGHPSTESFVSALAASYAQGAAHEGASVRTIHLTDLSFDPILRRGYKGEQALEPDLVSTLEAIRAARHVVFAFPTWWAAPPALVKGFVDRLFLPGVAFEFEKGKALATGLFAGRSARLMTTMDSPAFWYWLKHGRALHNAFISATMEFVGLGPIQSRAVYGVRTMDERARGAALSRAAQDGATDAQRVRRAGALLLARETRS